MRFLRLLASDGTRIRLTVRTKYPIRHLRYWFASAALADLHERLKRLLRVLEVGVDNGDMLCFVEGRRISEGKFALLG
jgi:hypothetical protein